MPPRRAPKRRQVTGAFQVREVEYNTELLTKFLVINGSFVLPVKAARVPCFENTLLIQRSGWSVFRLGVILLPTICFCILENLITCPSKTR